MPTSLISKSHHKRHSTSQWNENSSDDEDDMQEDSQEMQIGSPLSPFNKQNIGQQQNQFKMRLETATDL